MGTMRARSGLVFGSEWARFVIRLWMQFKNLRLAPRVLARDDTLGFPGEGPRPSALPRSGTLDRERLHAPVVIERRRRLLTKLEAWLWEKRRNPWCFEKRAYEEGSQREQKSSIEKLISSFQPSGQRDGTIAVISRSSRS